MKSGQNIDGYELVERIAQGGMGTIWKARHPHLDRWVAIKQIRAEVRDDQTIRDAFLLEVRNLSRLHSPQIVQVIDSGITDDGLPYMVTEFLEGEDLRSKLDRESSVSVPEALSIGISVLKALAEAHGIGLVHRDLKPGNIFLQTLAGEAEPAVKVLDFGVSKLMSSDGFEPQLEPSMGAKGSPRYMAPEQVLNETITPAVDIYSFGATLFRMVTGVHMFQGGPLDVLRRQVDTIPRPVRELAPDAEIPEELEDLIAGCLRKAPEDRPLSAAALRSRLEVILSRIRATGHEIDPPLRSRSTGSMSGDNSLPDWFQSTVSPSFSAELVERSAKNNDIDDIEIREPDDSLDGSILDWSAGPVIGAAESVPVEETADSLLSSDTVAELIVPESSDFDMVQTLEEAHSTHFLEDLRSKPIEPVNISDPEISACDESEPEEEGERFSSKQLMIGGVIGAVLVLSLGLGFGLTPSAPEPIQEPLRRDASVSEWIKKVGTEIREKEKKVDRSVPTVVRRWANVANDSDARVTIEIEQGFARFVTAKTGVVLCKKAVECQVPITQDIKVIKRGFRTEKLSRNELSDRRETRWRITLRR